MSKATKFEFDLQTMNKIQPIPNEFAYGIMDLHIHRKQNLIKKFHCKTDKFYKRIFPLRFELWVSPEIKYEDWFNDLTIYMSSNNDAPNHWQYQKVITGKRFFLFDAEDYFRNDFTSAMYNRSKKKRETILSLDNKMRANPIYNRPYLHMGIYYNT